MYFMYLRYQYRHILLNIWTAKEEKLQNELKVRSKLVQRAGPFNINLVLLTNQYRNCLLASSSKYTERESLTLSSSTKLLVFMRQRYKDTGGVEPIGAIKSRSLPEQAEHFPLKGMSKELFDSGPHSIEQWVGATFLAANALEDNIPSAQTTARSQMIGRLEHHDDLFKDGRPWFTE